MSHFGCVQKIITTTVTTRRDQVVTKSIYCSEFCKKKNCKTMHDFRTFGLTSSRNLGFHTFDRGHSEDFYEEKAT